MSHRPTLNFSKIHMLYFIIYFHVIQNYRRHAQSRFIRLTYLRVYERHGDAANALDNNSRGHIGVDK